MTENPAKQLVDFTETWWGLPLDDDLVNKIGMAPFKHLEAFYEEWPNPQSGHPELDTFILPNLMSGEVRPAVQGNDLFGLDVLLYSESLLLSSIFLSPLHEMHLRRLGHFPVSKKDTQRGARCRFGLLAKLRPLIERNLVYFTNVTALPYQYPSYLRGPQEFQIGQIATNNVDEVALLTRNSELTAIRQLFNDRLATPVALNAVDEQVMNAWRFHATPDRAPARIASLLKISTPDLKVDIKDLVSLRTNDALFAQWRSVLRGALDEVAKFDSSLESAREAREVVGRELDYASRELRAALQKSRTLSRLVSGLRGFAVGTLVAGGAVAFDERDFMSKTVAAVSGGAVSGVIEALGPSLKNVNNTRLLDRLVLSFQAQG